MIEHGLYFALGFLSACMLVLLGLPLIWRRAHRLTRREIEATLPLSPKEIAAERDQIRARNSVEKLQLEQALDASRSERQRTLRESGERLAIIAKTNGLLTSEQAAHATARDKISQLTGETTALRGDVSRLNEAVETSTAFVTKLKSDIATTSATLAQTEADLSKEARENAALKANSEAQLKRIEEFDQKARLLLSELHRTRDLLQTSERQSRANQKEIDGLTRKLAAAEDVSQKRAAQVAASEARHAEMNEKFGVLARLGKEGQAQIQEEKRRAASLEKLVAEREKSLERIRVDARDTAADLTRSLEKLRGERDRLQKDISETRATTSVLQRELNILRKSRQIEQQSNLMQAGKRAAE